MIPSLPDRILWPDGIIRVLFSLLAVSSAAALYFASPIFATSPRLFATATLVLFVSEVGSFEVWIRHVNSLRNQRSVQLRHDLEVEVRALASTVRDSLLGVESQIRFESGNLEASRRLSEQLTKLFADLNESSRVADARSLVITETIKHTVEATEHLLRNDEKHDERLTTLGTETKELKSSIEILAGDARNRILRDQKLTADILELNRAVERIAQQTKPQSTVSGKIVAPNDLAAIFYPSGSGERVVEQLDRPEIQIVSLITKGMTNREIAKIMGVSAASIKFKINLIFRKLNVSSRLEVAEKGRTSSPSLWIEGEVKPPFLPKKP